jgi:hypothetical protein
MRCYCCDAEVQLGRKVKLRVWREFEPGQDGLDSTAYLAYAEEMTFRWAFVCLACYRTLDNEIGVGEVGAHLFNLAGQSRSDRAAVVAGAKYRAFQRREAAKLGLET